MELLKLLGTLLYQNWLSLAILLLMVLIALYAVKIGQKAKVYKIVYALVARAEQKFGVKTGGIKYGYVIGKFYSFLPLIIRLAFSEKDVSEMIDMAVAELKRELTVGAFTLDPLVVKHKSKEGVNQC